MEENKYLIDRIFEFYKNLLPKRLRPYAFKIVFGAVCVGIMALIVHAYGYHTLLGIILFIVIIYGIIAILVLIQWLFKIIFKRSNQ